MKFLGEFTSDHSKMDRGLNHLYNNSFGAEKVANQLKELKFAILFNILWIILTKRSTDFLIT